MDGIDGLSDVWCDAGDEAKNLLQQLLTGVQHLGRAMDLSRREVQLQGKNIVMTLLFALAQDLSLWLTAWDANMMKGPEQTFCILL